MGIYKPSFPTKGHKKKKKHTHTEIREISKVAWLDVFEPSYERKQTTTKFVQSFSWMSQEVSKWLVSGL